MIGQDVVVPEEYTIYFRSAIAFGTIHILEIDKDKRSAIEKLVIKYAPKDTAENADRQRPGMRAAIYAGNNN